jgi:CHASE2 domain-containing sensor protein/signal transduction histidine kinase
MSSRRLAFEWWGLLALVISAALFLGAGPVDQASGTLSRLDLAMFDFGKRLVAIEPANDLVLVEIDETSLGQLGRWPWPRKLHASLIAKLKVEGAVSVGLDLLLSEPSGDDAVLARSFEQLPVQLPVSRSVESTNGLWPVYPVLALGAQASIAHPHFRVDSDGNVRGLYLNEAGFPAFALGMLRFKDSAAVPFQDLPIAKEAWANATQERRNQALVSKSWPSQNFAWLYPLKSPLKRYSYGDVLRGEFPKDSFKGKAVLIGANAEGLGDRYSSSLLGLPGLVVGVQLHAVAYAGLSQKAMIYRLSSFKEILFSVLGLTCLLVLLYGTSPRAGLLITLVFVLLWVSLCWLLLSRGYWLPPAAVMAAALASYPLWSWRRLEAAVANLRRQSTAMAAQPAWLSGFARESRSLEPIARDLSALDRAADRLMQLKRFLSSVLEKLPHPAFVADIDGSVRLANPPAYDAFAELPRARDELSPTHPEGSAVTWLRTFFEGQPGIVELTQDPLRTEKQIEATDKLGREWLIEVKPLGDPWKLWLVQFVDITHIKAVQREREQMLAFLTHDIRSPQVTILSALTQAGDAKHESWAQTIELEARRGLNLAESYVQWARAEHKDLRRDDTDMFDLCTEVVDSFWLKAEPLKIRIELLGEGPFWAQVDQTLYRRALANLVENALRYSPPGGVIKIRILADGGEWRIEVSDQGPGVLAQDIDKIFEPYVRGSGAMAPSSDAIGAGLGLAFVRLVVARHGGSIAVRNLAPSGACFSFTVPASI